MKQVDKLVDLAIQFPLLGIGVACIVCGVVPAGLALVASHFFLNRVDREESDNIQR